MKHLDLFSGLGLFSYAADHVWNLEHVFCEIEDWPYRFLKQEYPNARIERDIKNFDGTEYAGGTFLLTAGVPCQPASVAGKRKGTEDNRWLWPEALRVLREAQPTWAIFENPDGIFTLENGLVFENLLLEMEGSGYEVQPYFIPACAIGAIHRRGRWWIVAKSKQSRTGSQEREIADEGRETGEGWGEGLRQGNGKVSTGRITPTNPNAPNSKSGKTQPTEQGGLYTEFSGKNRNVTNTSIARSGELSKSDRRDDSADVERESGDAADPDRLNGNNAGYGSGEIRGELWKEAGIQGCDWQKPWPEVATELCRVDVSPTNRVHRLKALGNTIQWEVAYQIMQAIKEIDEGL